MNIRNTNKNNVAIVIMMIITMEHILIIESCRKTKITGGRMHNGLSLGTVSGVWLLALFFKITYLTMNTHTPATADRSEVLN